MLESGLGLCAGTGVRVVHEEDKFPFPLSNRDFVQALRYPVLPEVPGDSGGGPAPPDAAATVVLASVQHRDKPAGKKKPVRAATKAMYTLQPAPLEPGGDAEAGCRFSLTTWFELGGGLPAKQVNKSVPSEMLKMYTALFREIPKLPSVEG